MKSLLKIFITVLFSVFLETYSMEKQPQENIEIDLSNLPKDLWLEIAKYGINKNAQTEKEIFQMVDSLRATSKTTKEAVDNLVKTRSLKKNKPNYNYVDLKNDIMQDILIERAKINVPLRADDSLVMPSVNKIKQYKAEILNQAIKAEAINWSRYRLTIDPNFQKRLYEKLLYTDNEKDFETLLKMGTNPNFKYPGPGDTLPSVIIISTRPGKSPKLLELLLKYGANPNARSESAHPEYNAINWIMSKISFDSIQDPIENIKILLKYGIKITPDQLNLVLEYDNKLDHNDGDLSRKIKIIRKSIISILEDHLKEIEKQKLVIKNII